MPGRSRIPAALKDVGMDGTFAPYRLAISFVGKTWREMPRGYRQDGTVLERVGGVVVPSIGRGNVVFYRAVPDADLVTAERAGRG